MEVTRKELVMVKIGFSSNNSLVFRPYTALSTVLKNKKVKK